MYICNTFRLVYTGGCIPLQACFFRKVVQVLYTRDLLSILHTIWTLSAAMQHISCCWEYWRCTTTHKLHQQRNTNWFRLIHHVQLNMVSCHMEGGIRKRWRHMQFWEEHIYIIVIKHTRAWSLYLIWKFKGSKNNCTRAWGLSSSLGSTSNSRHLSRTCVTVTEAPFSSFFSLWPCIPNGKRVTLCNMTS